jgi:hypothetical protein
MSMAADDISVLGIEQDIDDGDAANDADGAEVADDADPAKDADVADGAVDVDGADDDDGEDDDDADLGAEGAVDWICQFCPSFLCINCA